MAKNVLSALNYFKSAAVCSGLSSLSWFFLSWEIISNQNPLFQGNVLENMSDAVQAEISGIILSTGLGIASVASDVYGYDNPNFAVLGNLISKICAFMAGGQMVGWHCNEERLTRIINTFFVPTLFDTVSSSFAQTKPLYASIFSGLSSLSWGISAFSWTDQDESGYFEWKLSKSPLDWVKAAVAGTGAVITNPMIALPLLRKLSGRIPENIAVPLLNFAFKSCAVLAGKSLAKAKDLKEAKKILNQEKPNAPADRHNPFLD